MRKNTLLLSAYLTFASPLFLFAQTVREGKHHAIDLSNLDTDVKPSDDFYAYSVGNWIKKNPVPASKSSWYSFNELFEHNKLVLHEAVLDAAVAKAPEGSNTQKVGDFFASGMDSIKRNQLGYSPIKPYLLKIDAINSKNDVLNMLAFLNVNGFASVYDFSVDPDDKNSTVYIPKFYQSGLGLPDRDYYLKNDSVTAKIRFEYVGYVSKLFTLIGEPKSQADQDAAKLLKLETQLAQFSMDRVTLRDPYASYHKMTAKEFTQNDPAINWSVQLGALGMKTAPDSLIVGQPDFFKNLGVMLTSISVNDWKTYLRWKLLSSSAGALSDDFQIASFNFNGKVLNGTKVQEKRWERITRVIDGYMGEALGKEYVKKAFPPEAKVRMLELIKNLKLAFGERIQNLDWMSDSTKKKALVKLNAIMVKVGYPDKWRDYGKLTILRGKYFENVVAARHFEYERILKRYGKPVDKAEWGMTPPTVNAYYNPSFNEIVFPAGILQPPFFDFLADDAVNYGAIGAVIGHEMTHGFDDEGRQYDAEGNLKDWWTKQDAANFKKKADLVVAQFDVFKVDTMHVNGKLTLGENLADLGGTMIAYQAFKKTKQGKGTEKIDGYTPDQRFFLGFAQVWRGNILPQAAALRVKTDPHSPGKYRVIGPLSNNENFYNAFSVKEGDAMYKKPSDRIVVW